MHDPQLDLSQVRDAHVLPPEAPKDPKARALQPLERLRLLADEGSLQVIRSAVTSDRMGDKARPGDGVVGGALRIGGRPVFCFAQDASYAGGSLGARTPTRSCASSGSPARPTSR